MATVEDKNPKARMPIESNLAMELVRVTEAAAMAAALQMGKGSKDLVDQAAVDAMRFTLEGISMDGVVVIGEGENEVTPSVLSWNNGRWLVAQEAQKKRISDPENTVFSIKRLMGRGLEDLEKMAKDLPYKIIETDRKLHKCQFPMENVHCLISK